MNAQNVALNSIAQLVVNTLLNLERHFYINECHATIFESLEATVKGLEASTYGSKPTEILRCKILI